MKIIDKELLSETFTQPDLSEGKTRVVCFNLVLRTCYIMLCTHWEMIPGINNPNEISPETTDIMLMASAAFSVIEEEARVNAKQLKKPQESLLLQFALRFSSNILNKSDDPSFVTDFYKGIKKVKKDKKK